MTLIGACARAMRRARWRPRRSPGFASLRFPSQTGWPGGTGVRLGASRHRAAILRAELRFPAPTPRPARYAAKGRIPVIPRARERQICERAVILRRHVERIELTPSNQGRAQRPPQRVNKALVTTRRLCLCLFTSPVRAGDAFSWLSRPEFLSRFFCWIVM